MASYKIIIITSKKLPDYLSEALNYHKYIFETTSTIEDINFADYHTVVIDSSTPKDYLSKSQNGMIPSAKTSFFANLDKFNSPDNKKYLTSFLAKVEGDLSVNHKKYEFCGETKLVTEYGDFIFFGFQSRVGNKNILGVRTYDFPNVPVVRTHSMCYTGDIFHSLKCNCREELQNALRYIHEQGGILIYPEEGGRGVGVLNKIKIYQCQEKGADTVEAQHLKNFPNDLRTYDYLKDIFFHFALTEIRLVTNNPDKITACYDSGVVVSDVIKLPSTITSYNQDYLKTKMLKNNHNFKFEFSANEENPSHSKYTK